MAEDDGLHEGIEGLGDAPDLGKVTDVSGSRAFINLDVKPSTSGRGW